MQNRKLDLRTVLSRKTQRFAKLIHRLKAKYKTKERPRCQMLGKYFAADSTIIDVGAHFGYLSKEFSRLHNSSCVVHAFEPTTYNFDILKDVCSHLANVVLNNVALSDEIGTATINIPVKKQGKIGPGLAHFGDEIHRDFICETINTITLDQYVSDNTINRVDFIKCDVEGAELLVFRGGINTIQKYKPIVFTEICGEMTVRLGYKPQDIFDFFHKLNYTAYVFVDDFTLSGKIDHYTKTADYLFRPPESLAS